MQIYAKPPLNRTKALLASCDLPSEDLDPNDLEHFFGCDEADELLGVVGLEIYGDVALLRSLAVAEARRHRGYGKRLVAAAEEHALDHGVREIYLLTETARTLFESMGYAPAARETAPIAIRGTREFSSICPAGATFMLKQIAAQQTLR